MLVITVVFFNLAFPLDPQPQKRRAERRFINEDAAKKFSMFDRCLLEGHSDADTFIRAFNSQCLDILDQVAPVKLAHAVHKYCPWVDDCIKAFQRSYGRQQNLKFPGFI